MKLCNFLTSRKNRLKVKNAQKLIDHELDIVQFIRNQLEFKCSKQVIFSKAERFLLTHQAEPYVLSSKDTKVESEYQDAMLVELLESHQPTKRFNKLVEGVFSGT